MIMNKSLLLLLLPPICCLLDLFCPIVTNAESNSGAKILFEKLLNRPYFRPNIRPVKNHSEPLIMYMNLSLTNILDVDEKNQIVSLNMWVFQQWYDPNFRWDPLIYENITEINVPSDNIWTPDLVLYNNAGGDWDLAASSTKVKAKYNGLITWKPPVIFESQCEINVEFFPFDTQECKLKLGTWTHNGLVIDLRHVAQQDEAIKSKRILFDKCEAKVHNAIDLSDFVPNVEWDVLDVFALRNIQKYACCPEPYLDLTFYIKIRRKTLFYGVNLIFPCLAISFLTVFVFYIPGQSREKIHLSINVLLSLTVFFLLIFDICPPTSIVVPLILKYLLFTMILVTLSVMSTVIILNVHTRSPDTYKMSPWVKHLFTTTLPKLLLMQKPEKGQKKDEVIPTFSELHDTVDFMGMLAPREEDHELLKKRLIARRKAMTSSGIIDEIELAMDGVLAIANHMRQHDEDTTARSDWKYVAVVLDRLFLWLFSCAAMIGAFGIFMQAPSLRDSQKPLTSFQPEHLLPTVVRNCSMKSAL